MTPSIPAWWPREAPMPHMLAVPRYVSPAERAGSHKVAMKAKKLVKEKHNDAD
jgi:hypothetical protein